MKRLFIILIIFISFTQINAYALPSDRVIYDNDYSKSTNVKEALDELYEKLKNDELELERINKIGNALPSEIVAGKTAYVNGTEVTGTMPTKEGQTYTPTTTNQVVNSGYYLVGDQIILGDSNLLAQNIRNGVSIFGVNGTFTSDANATAGELLKNKTAYVNGQKITGTIESKVAATYTPGTQNQTIASGQYLSGAQTITGDANLAAGNIKKGISIFGVAGTFTGDANATAGEIIKGKTAYVNGNKITGTIENFGNNWVWANADNNGGNGVAEYTYSSGTKARMLYLYTRPGYITKDTKIIVEQESVVKSAVLAGKSLLGVAGTATSDANATAAQILKDKTAYVNGAKITGTIASKAAATYTPGTANQTIASGQYLSGVQTIKGDSNLTAANIKKGVSIFGVSGTYTSDANATAAQILKNQTAYVNGNKITGTMANNGAMNKSITAGGSVSIPAGYTTGGTVDVKHVIKSWTPNYGQWTSTDSMYTTDTYTVNATDLYVFGTSENGGTLTQYAAPSCSSGTVTLLNNSNNVVLYKIHKTASATFTLSVLINRKYSSYPNATIKLYAFTLE